MAEDQGVRPPPPLLMRRKGSAADRLFQSPGNFLSKIQHWNIAKVSLIPSVLYKTSQYYNIVKVTLILLLFQLFESLDCCCAAKYEPQATERAPVEVHWSGWSRTKTEEDMQNRHHLFYRCGILSLDRTCKAPSQSTWTGSWFPCFCSLRLLIARGPFGLEGIDKGMQSWFLRLAAFTNVWKRFVRIQMCAFSALCINHVSYM